MMTMDSLRPFEAIDNEAEEFVEQCLPFVEPSAYPWMQQQSTERSLKKHGVYINGEIRKRIQKEIQNHSKENEYLWKRQILTKIYKNIQEPCRKSFIKALQGYQEGCILSNPDPKNKMRRVDSMGKANKVWKLHIIVMNVFRGTPLKSTDSDRVTRSPICQYGDLCINPGHLQLRIEEIDFYISKMISKGMV